MGERRCNASNPFAGRTSTASVSALRPRDCDIYFTHVAEATRWTCDAGFAGPKNYPKLTGAPAAV